MCEAGLFFPVTLKHPLAPVPKYSCLIGLCTRGDISALIKNDTTRAAPKKAEALTSFEASPFMDFYPTNNILEVILRALCRAGKASAASCKVNKYDDEFQFFDQLKKLEAVHIIFSICII